MGVKTLWSAERDRDDHNRTPAHRSQQPSQALPHQAGASSARGRRHSRGGRRELRHQGGRDARPRRRERLRQDYDGALHPPRHRPYERRGAVHVSERRDYRRRRRAPNAASQPAPRNADDIPRPVLVAEPPHDAAGHRGRAACDRGRRDAASAKTALPSFWGLSACDQSSCAVSPTPSAADSDSASA